MAFEEESTDHTSWSVPEALGVALEAFTKRFGADLLWAAFQQWTADPQSVMAEHRAIEASLDQYLAHALAHKGAAHVVWMANARADDTQAVLLLHIGVRWWRARDDLLRRLPQARVPCEYASGLTDHVNHQLLCQMLYRGSAPYTTCD